MGRARSSKGSLDSPPPAVARRRGSEGAFFFKTSRSASLYVSLLDGRSKTRARPRRPWVRRAGGPGAARRGAAHAALSTAASRFSSAPFAASMVLVEFLSSSRMNL